MKPVLIKAEPTNTEWKWMAICEQHSDCIVANVKKELATLQTYEFCNSCFWEMAADNGFERGE